MRGRLPVQGRMPEGSRIDSVDRLAQVHLEVLARATPLTVKGDGRHGAGDDRDTDASAEAVRSGQNGIVSEDGDRATGLPLGKADVGQEVLQRDQGVERRRAGRCRCPGGDVRVRWHSHGATTSPFARG